MSPTLKTHLTSLEKSAVNHPSAAALKIPHWEEDGVFCGWKTITFSQFLNDVENAARYWANELLQRGIKERDIVGVWVKGVSYLDAVQIWGIARAGYIPQLISLRLTHLDVVYDVLKLAGAKAIIFDSTFLQTMKADIVALPVVNTRSMSLEHLLLPQLWVPSEQSDIVMIYHSSGTTSGRPKIVPLTARWVDHAIESVEPIFRGLEGQQVVASHGSFCHIAAAMSLMGWHDLGHCVILSKDIPPSPAELKSMVNEYGLTVLFLFSSFLSKSLREARSDPELLRSLQSIPSVLHGGLALSPDDATWARTNDLYLKNVFASTEVGLMMFGVGGSGSDAGYLQPPPGVTYRFIPVSGSSAEGPGSENARSGEQLLELVVPSKSRNCPDESLRTKETGDFHTGDLFAEPIHGHFLSRGRNDDWIKMEISLRCDTKSIEGNVMELCGKDLVSTAVCLGTGRPSPALLVEPLQEKDGDDYSALKDEIVRRIRPFHERMYTHERIEDPRFIIACPKGSLPRTSKGGVPRTVVERIYEKALDEIYARK
ncbi:unnamed protein product [Clonostachys byssicola]|uniref:AMP-dependent synthetase/ligase domain-containing protein n=1 Tax=Clonostachys byssicola TaxID=160290 RepID=A0A9N9Y6M4_9HYPO|nr:unnamed protein product [Clonostachys byssicola]